MTCCRYGFRRELQSLSIEISIYVRNCREIWIRYEKLMYIFLNKSCNSESIAGKTTLLHHLLKQWDHVTCNPLPISQLIICYEHYQPIYEQIIGTVKKMYPNCKVLSFWSWKEEVMRDPAMWQVPDGTQSLLIADDCMEKLHRSEGLAAICRGRSHHDSISLILLTQDLSSTGMEFKSAIKNMHYIILTQGNAELLQVLQRKLYPYSRGFLQNAFETCRKHCKTNYPYIVIDSTPGCPRHLSVKTGLFRDENALIFSPVL